MKKWISIFLSAAVVFSLAACGTAAVEKSTSSSSSAEVNMTYEGTVSAISSQSITVSGRDGETVIKLSDSTTVSRDFGMGEDRPHIGGGPSGGNGLPDGQREAPPEKPSEPSGNSQDAPPEPPQGEAPEPMGGQPQSLTTAGISVGDTVTVKTDSTGVAETILLSGGEMDIPEKQDGAMGGPGGMASGVDSYDAVTAFPADAEESGGTYRSTGADENAVHVYEGASVTLEDASIFRESDSSTGGDTSSFYGVGAAALVTDGSLSIGGSTIESDASGGTGVFAYGDGTAYVWDTTIDTKQNTSGGIHVAGGGTLYAWDLTVETDGESSAAIRSDRGSGTMVVDGGSYTSNGQGSPAIYSAADITVHNAALTATGSEAVCIEGFNTIRLFDCDLVGDMEDLSQNDCTWTVTGGSCLTSLHCAGTITDPNGNAVTVQGTDGSVYVQGSSPYTITVDTYNSDADCSAASTVEHWSDFTITKP